MARLEPTKPAGCALQVIGGTVFLGGLLATMGGSLVGGVVAMGVAIWLLAVGRRPAVRGRQ